MGIDLRGEQLALRGARRKTAVQTPLWKSDRPRAVEQSGATYAKIRTITVPAFCPGGRSPRRPVPGTDNRNASRRVGKCLPAGVEWLTGKITSFHKKAVSLARAVPLIL